MTPQRFDELRIKATERVHDYSDLPSQAELNEALDEIARLAALVYVPGCFKCPACGFTLTTNVISVTTGAIAAKRHCADPCPNDGVVMEPVLTDYGRQQIAVINRMKRPGVSAPREIFRALKATSA